MRKQVSRLSIVALTCALAMITGWAQQQELPRFTRERTIQTAGPGPQRLPTDATLLEAGQPFHVTYYGETAIAQNGLGDLRLVDGQGRPVPHLLIYPPSREPLWANGVILPIAPTKKTSGFEVDLRIADPVDALRIEGIPVPFLKRLTLEGSGDREHWTLLAAEVTLFDLPDERLRETTVRFRRGSYRYLRVMWDDTNSGRVPPPRSASARVGAGAAPPPPPAAAMAFERRPSEPGRSRYRIRLSGARLPIVALDLDAAGGHIFRPAVVNESRLVGEEAVPAQLGHATLIRVLRDGTAAQALRIPLTSPTEAEIELVVEDGNNPPLELKGAAAVFAELPWIYFEAPDSAVVARYGDPAARPPRYDLEAMRDSIDIAHVREAKWEQPRVLATVASPSAAAPVPATGAEIDATRFRHVRDLPDGSAGLLALQLDAAVLSQSKGPSTRFADVRIVDRANRQVPYLVERRDEPLSIDIPIAVASEQQTPALTGALQGTNRSCYQLRLPFARLPAGSLALETSARIFQRNVELGIVRPPDRERRDAWFDAIAAGTWRHADQQTSAPLLTLRIPSVDVTEVFLAVDEGDNAPLPVVAARLLLPSYRLRFFRPEKSELRVGYGRDDLAAPRYDLSLLAPQVMGAAAREIAAAPERGGGSRSSEPSLISARTFWIFLGVAVLALLALIVKLVRAT
jgi:Protein of unknown function (DUF3999)